jgi:hypothetical protein
MKRTSKQKPKKSAPRQRLCAKGLHRMTADNTYEHPSKGPECRECKRTYMREYMRELRAAARR